MRMSTDLKSELLRLLREDEEFRLAVMGLLGYTDLKSSVDRLAKTIREQSRAIEELVKAVKEQSRAIEELSRAVKSHEEGLTKLEDVVKELTKAVKSHEERLAKVEDAVKELVEVTRSHEERLARFEKPVEDVKKGVDDLKKIYERLDRRLSRVERTLENITVSAEEEANIVVQYLLKQRGITIETKPTTFNSKFEFDVYGTNGQVTIIGETKTRVGPGVIRRLTKRVDRARKKWPDRFRGRVVVVLYCLRALPGAVEEAERYGVWLIEDMKERTALRI
jgi:predicted  nucleic acid-binding Zn-ribbon protein